MTSRVSLRFACVALLALLCVSASALRVESQAKHASRIRILAGTKRAETDVASAPSPSHTAADDDPWDMTAYHDHMDEELEREFPSETKVERDYVVFGNHHGKNEHDDFRFNQANAQQGLEAMALLRQSLAMAASALNTQLNNGTNTSASGNSTGNASADSNVTSNATAANSTGSSNVTNGTGVSNSTSNSSVVANSTAASNVTAVTPDPNVVVIPEGNGTDILKTLTIMWNKTLNDPTVPKIWYGERLEHNKPWPLGFPKFETPPADTDRVFPEPACYYCKYFAILLSDAIIQRRLNRYNSVVMAQAICQQHGWERALGFECASFAKMQEWLFKGGLLHPKREFYTSSIRHRLMWIRHDPTQFCIINSFCLTRGQNDTALATEAKRDHNSGAVIVRFRLKHRLEQILPPTRYPRDSKTFKRFVKNFLGEIASALRCPVGRLQFHLHSGSQLVEIVIAKYDGAARLPNSARSDPSVKLFTDAPPVTLGLRLKGLVEGVANSLQRPNRLTSLIDTNFRAQVYPLVLRETLKQLPRFPAPPRPANKTANATRPINGTALVNVTRPINGTRPVNGTVLLRPTNGTTSGNTTLSVLKPASGTAASNTTVSVNRSSTSNTTGSSNSTTSRFQSVDSDFDVDLA